MQWYYAKGGSQLGPLEDDAFHELVRSGQISPETPVWREGMPNWAPYGQVSGRRAPTEPRTKLTLQRDTATPHPPESAAAEAGGEAALPADAASAGGGPIATLIEPLYRGKGWMRFTGILTIICGVLEALGPGIVVAWIPIWMGILLTGAAKQVAAAYEGEDEMAMTIAMDKLRLYFKVMGILAIVMLVVAIIMLAAIGLPLLRHLPQRLH